MNYLNYLWKNLPIGIRYVIFISVVITITILALSFMFIEQQQRTAEAALENRAELLLDVIGSGIQRANSATFVADINLLASEIEGNENITSVRFYTAQGEVVSNSSTAEDAEIWQQMVADDQDYYQQKQETVTVGRIIYKDDNPVGGIILELATDEFDSQVSQARRQVFLFTIIAIPVCIFLVSLFSNQVIHRIQKLTVAAEEVARGELTEVSYHSKDELGELSSTFNKMAQALWERDQKLRELNNSLEARVHERTSELEKLANTLHEANKELFQATQEAEEASRLKSEILATMSHELRTPLNAIIGFTDILLAEMDGEVNTTQRTDLERIMASSEHLLSMIDATLNIAQIEAGRARLREDIISIPTIVDELLEPYQVSVKTKQLKLITEIDPSMPPQIVADKQRIEHIITNLLNNALKFTEQGSITFAIKPLLAQNQWQIMVSDTGIGLTDENQRYIFEAFRQVDSSVSRKYEGIGLGLTVVQRTVELMNGQIDLQSQEGAGCTFTVTLPLKLAIASSPE